jgi:thiamine-monophosphate kinase
VEYGQALTGIATAAIDLSDGLFADLCKLLNASGVGGVLQIEKLPLSTELRAMFDPETQRRFALSGGDDYELCFTAPVDSAPVLDGLPVTNIGFVTDDESLVCHLDGQVVSFEDSGYRHFQ